MKWLILVFILILCPNMSMAQLGDSVKCWTNDVKLEWSDFLGKVPYVEQNMIRLVAVCANQIIVTGHSKKTVLNYKVQVVFFRNLSWTVDSSAYGLAHEQLHFDIAELYARKIRLEIMQLKDKDVSRLEDFWPIVDKILAEKGKEQELYDYETVHGILKNWQLKWRNKVDKELELLKAFSSTPEDCQ